MSVNTQQIQADNDRGSPRLLVIDDDMIQRTIISKIGPQAGYQSDTAATFEDAERMLREGSYDLITLDLSLGEHSGTQLLRTIAETGKTPVIVISGCEERILNSAVRLANLLDVPSHHMPKPLDLSELRRAFVASIPGVTRSEEKKSVAVDASTLEKAIDANEIVPWFQPKIDLTTGAVVGCEALARWRHPTEGMIPPDVFVPLAEKSGLMPKLTHALLRSATIAVRDIVKQHPDFSVAVNVSPSLMRDNELSARIDEALEASGLPPRALTVEITETTVMADVTKATEILVELRVKGVGVSIDDFGVGYSSPAALACMPFSELKIDQSLVRNSETDPDMARVVRACARLGHELSMKVVAEGIETEAQMKIAREGGCDIGQGHHLAQAFDIELLTAWIGQRREPVHVAAGEADLPGLRQPRWKLAVG